MKQGIPTIYRSYRFRSRLEAIWARFFDAVGWAWKYEPLDYPGYIPDFVLLLPYGHVLVEVKPGLSLDELFPHAEKIDRSPWKKEALILGAGFIEGSDSGWDQIIGLLGCLDYGNVDGSPAERVWEPGRFNRCVKCRRYSFHAVYGSFHCRASGCYDGDHYLGDDDHEYEKIWALAQNLVQWAPQLSGVDRSAV